MQLPFKGEQVIEQKKSTERELGAYLVQRLPTYEKEPRFNQDRKKTHFSSRVITYYCNFCTILYLLVIVIKFAIILLTIIFLSLKLKYCTKE